MNKEIIPVERIAQKILYLRSQKVILDRDLAALYDVETRVLNQAVKRNADRFPDDFVFILSREEIERISQTVTSSSGLKFAKQVRVAPRPKLEREIGFHVRERAARYRTRNHR